MSKTSRLLIGIMVTALLFMGAVRGYQFYQQKVQEWEEERQEQADAQFSFQQVPLSLSAPQAERTAPMQILPADRTSMNVLPVQIEAEPTPVSQTTPAPDQAVFLEDAPLEPEELIAQAKETLKSIVQDYKNDPQIKAFNAELAKTTQGQAADLVALSGGNLQQLLQANPQIQSVISKHMQDPDFAAKIEQIFSNPQFVESVRQLQQKGVRLPPLKSVAVQKNKK